jgi:hypothetical protein
MIRFFSKAQGVKNATRCKGNTTDLVQHDYTYYQQEKVTLFLRSASIEAPRNGAASKIGQKQNDFAPDGPKAIIQGFPRLMIVSFQVDSFHPVTKDHH